MNYTLDSGFHILSDENPGNIFLQKNAKIALFIKNTSKNISLHIGENTFVEVFGYFNETCPQNIDFFQDAPNSHLTFRGLFLDTNSLTSQVISHVQDSHCFSDISLVSIVEQNKISLDSAIIVDKSTSKTDAKLELENIFIGEKGAIVSNPNLYVNTHDVKISHASKTHKIDSQKLFYLLSRGIDKDDATTILIEGYFRQIFMCLSMYNEEIYNDLLAKFSQKKD